MQSLLNAAEIMEMITEESIIGVEVVDLTAQINKSIQ